MDCQGIIGIVTSVILCIITFLLNVVHTRKKIQEELGAFKKRFIYEKKAEILKEVLSLVEDYYSWLQMSSGRIPVRAKTNTEDLTIRARNCYDNLCVYCGNSEILILFCDLIFNEECEIEKFNDLRNCIREELSLPVIDISRDYVFVAKVSTKILEEFEKTKPKE